MVLDGVVGSPLQDLGDFGPFVAQSAVVQKEDPFFLHTPLDLLDFGVQMVVPSLSALLANPSRQVLGDLRPLLRPVRFNQVQNEPVLIFSPRAFDQARIEDLLPSVQALHIGSSRQRFSDLLPIFSRVLLNGICKHLILILGPVALHGVLMGAGTEF